MPVIVRDGIGLVTLQLAGTLDMACVADVDHALASAHRSHQRVVLDLGKVRLIDRPTLQYIIDVIQRDVQSVVNCPDHVRRWMEREQAKSDV